MSKLEAVDSSDSPLRLLRRVRDILRMAEDAQTRLNKLVKVVAGGFNSEVCSIYFVHGGKELELYATQGLKQQAVHTTILRYSEGLVGEIAATSTTLNLPEASQHPKFVYVEQTGEELFHSFVGVPILHQHRVIGVMTVQSVDARIYSDDQVEVLQTIAMVLAELAVASQVVSIKDLTGQDDGQNVSHYFSGMKLSPGLAKAPAVLHRPKIEITKLVTDNPSYEEQRLQQSIIDLQRSIDELIRKAGLHKGDSQLEIIETYRMFTHDRGWIERLSEAIRTGLTAEAAVKKVEEEMHARMAKIESTYIRDRMQDLEDLSNRLLYHLSGVSPTAAHADLPADGFVLVAQSIGPAELLEYADKNVAGIVVEEGSTGSHVAIIARMMDIPMVAGIARIAALVSAGDLTIVDGHNGEVYVRPPDDVTQAIDAHIASQREQDEAYEAQQHLPSVSKDGVAISLNANIGLYLDAKQLKRPDVDGIGLYRTELPYMASSDIPDVDEQKKIYAEVLRHAGGKPVIFRSFDIGGDKQVPYLDVGLEENPAMGWRATRVGLDRPVILRRQFRALIRAASGHDLYVMFPFIAEVEEYDETKSIFEREMERAKVEGYRLPKKVKLGSMIEIPSILFQLPELFKRVDFASVGSNDLLQFLYACDRGSERLSGRYDPLSPAFLRIMCDLVHHGELAAVPIGFCGSMASKPLEAIALIACGMRSLSVPLPSVGPLKAALRELELHPLSEAMQNWLADGETSVRRRLEEYLQATGMTF